MDRTARSALAVLLMCVIAGCGQTDSSDPARGGAPPASVSSVPSDPAARTAYEFLDAVVKGDTQRASSQLTPLAMERIIERHEQFSPPGDDSTAGFRIGQVAKPSQTEAWVQCFLTEAAPGQQPREAEICCLLRLVEGQWRVSGLAHTAGPNSAPMIFDFETGQHLTVPQGPGSGSESGQAPTHVAGRPAPPTAAPATSSTSVR